MKAFKLLSALVLGGMIVLLFWVGTSTGARMAMDGLATGHDGETVLGGLQVLLSVFMPLLGVWMSLSIAKNMVDRCKRKGGKGGLDCLLHED
ncbi:hypothetical protein Mmc1_1570 [Magnetococcus marinus MC-1]|uniref:MotA/TolQ/ExbB proton channel domain-containing protein n=1 Tax=Magnetococcus marinus (strain ATCC BAA-1437 / JCM 17883 / MC-1) TaxID=156889 RepID=A0L7Y6_MAGMM|nr:hypothetical protein [Magnetococcus marinus]ABK44079.1 hypothetical protein Mmc1_1570 [Magnetococcus marinus MC-1]